MTSPLWIWLKMFVMVPVPVIKMSKESSLTNSCAPTDALVNTPCSWLELAGKLAKCKTYSQVEDTVSKFHHSTPPLVIPERHSIVSTKSVVDKVSLDAMPGTVPNGLFPATIMGDGNCFPRTLSKMVYGSEDNHNEMRARLVCEAILNKCKYLDDGYLKIGADYHHKRASLPEIYAQYSEQYIPKQNSQLTSKEISVLYENEVVAIAK